MEEQQNTSLQEARFRAPQAQHASEALAQKAPPSDSALVEAFSFGYAEFDHEMSVRSLDIASAIRRSPVSILEAEKMGAKAGLVDKLYMRRDRLERSAVLAALKWSKRLAAVAPVDALYKALLNADDRDPKASVLRILMDVLNQYPDLAKEAKAITADAHAKASAEGTVSAGSLVNQKAGVKVPDLGDAHAKELAKAKKSDKYWNGSDTTVAMMLSGLAGDLVKTIGAAISGGAKPDPTRDAIVRTIALGAGAAWYIGTAVHSVYANSQLLQIENAGEKVDFTTVGDARVCPMCLEAEDGSPYPAYDVPPIPMHGSCRCFYTPAGSIL